MGFAELRRGDFRIPTLPNSDFGLRCLLFRRSRGTAYFFYQQAPEGRSGRGRGTYIFVSKHDTPKVLLLDTEHDTVQTVHTASGAFLHALRREGSSASVYPHRSLYILCYCISQQVVELYRATRYTCPNFTAPGRVVTCFTCPISELISI